MSAVSWRIRKAVTADAEAIIKLLHDTIEYHEMLHKFKGVSVEEFLEDCFGPRPWVYCIVAESSQDTNNRLIGYSTYYYRYLSQQGRGIYMIDLFVVPSERGKGLGQALMKELAKIAADEGCCCLLWDVDPDNSRALNFYKRLGATMMEGRTFMHLTISCDDKNTET